MQSKLLKPRANFHAGNKKWGQHFLSCYLFFFYAQQITLSRLYCLKPSKPIFKVITSYTTLQASSSLSFIYFQLICCFFSTNCTIFSSFSWAPTFSTLLDGWIDGEVCVCVYPVFPSLIITLALSNHIYPNNCYAREIWLTSYLYSPDLSLLHLSSSH